MNALILNIGDELLIGQIINTNAAYIAKELNLRGITVKKTEVIADSEEAILTSLQDALQYDLVIVTGGLGPTKDDITKQTFAKFIDDVLIENKDVLKDIENLLRSRNRTMNELNKRQALVLSKADVIRNLLGTAPGMIIKKEKTTFVSLPGVPFEMKPMLKDALSHIQHQISPGKIIHKNVLVFGIPESELALKIESWENALHKEGIRLAYLPNRNLIRLRLSAYSISNAEERIGHYVHQLKNIIGNHFVGEEDWNEMTDYPLAKALLQKLKARHLTLSSAESCTGGSIASMITKIPGASEVFKGGIVSYANEVKIHLLNVNKNVIENYGVVSKECVEEMAKGVQKIMDTDISIAVSGIAGPAGGTKEKPVGTVWMSICFHDKTEAKLFEFGNQSREYIIESSVFNALSWLMKKISD